MGKFIDRLKQEQSEEPDRPKWDPIKGKADWLARLNMLLTNIRTWMDPAVQEGLIRITPGTFQIEEDPDTLGTYEAPGLVLDLGQGRRLVVEPIAGICIGASGRVELHFRGCRSNQTIVLLHGADRWVVWPEARHLRWDPSKLPTLDEKIFESILDDHV